MRLRSLRPFLVLPLDFIVLVIRNGSREMSHLNLTFQIHPSVSMLNTFWNNLSTYLSNLLILWGRSRLKSILAGYKFRQFMWPGCQTWQRIYVLTPSEPFSIEYPYYLHEMYPLPKWVIIRTRRVHIFSIFCKTCQFGLYEWRSDGLYPGVVRNIQTMKKS